MRNLLDENLPVELAAELTGHAVSTVVGLRWQGIRNSELLRRAQRQFEVLMTMDRNLEFQQSSAEFGIAVLVVMARSNRVADLRLLVPAMLEALTTIRPGEVRRVGG